MKLSRIFLIAVVSLFITTNVFAGFGLKSLTGGGGVDVDALTKDQSALLKQVSAALLNLAKSQTLMADALGLKEEAAIATQNASTLESGDLTGKDDMEKQISSSQKVNDAIAAKIADSEALSAESKATFAKSLPPYGKGAVGMVLSSKTAIEKGKSLTKTKDLTVLTKLSPLISYAKKAPNLIKNTYSTTNSIIKFSKTNSIDTSELEDATSSW